MSFSRKCTKSLLDTMTGKVSSISVASDCFIALLKAEPAYVEGVLTYQEMTAAGYERGHIGQAQAASTQVMTDPDTTGMSQNEQTIFFPEFKEDGGTATHFALFNAKTGGEPHLWGALTAPVTIPQGYVPIFNPGTLSITLV